MEMKTGLLLILDDIPFDGFDHEDPYTYLTKFWDFCYTVRSRNRWASCISEIVSSFISFQRKGVVSILTDIDND